jgi:hypothetical protein
MATFSFSTFRNIALSLTLPVVGSQLLAQTFADAEGTAQMMRAAATHYGTVAEVIAKAPQALAPKKPGVQRIGVTLPDCALSDNTGPAAESLRELEKQFLLGPATEVVSLSGHSPSQVDAEAKSLECDFVLSSGLTEKKAGGMGLGGLKAVSALSSIGSAIPAVRSGAALASLASNQGLAAASALDLASRMKARSEVTFQYSLNRVGGVTLIADKQKAKPQNNGEDVLTPMLRAAADRISLTTQSAQ